MENNKKMDTKAPLERLVGMTDDYNGRHYIAENNTKPVLVSSFYCNEKQAFTTFTNYLSTLYPITDFGIETKKGNYYISSKKYATLFNKFYTYNEDKIGLLNQALFETDDKKVNFILGTFIRYGKITEKGAIEISFSNSLSHFKAVQDFVKELKWQIMELEDTGEKNFPQIQKIVFMPDNATMELFENNVLKDIIVQIKTHKEGIFNKKTVLTFTIINNKNEDYSFCYWQTPFEKEFMANYLRLVLKNGEKIKYIGKMVKRSPPDKDDFMTIKANSVISTEIILDNGYDIQNKKEFSIQFIGSSINKLPNSNIIN
ncbi:MAG TPA: hypothetical protein ENJ27_01410 [Candidatus Moranbacteria bacterium]|nr:hypothetical protein [Candidatus Moranbacteria bacterium]